VNYEPWINPTLQLPGPALGAAPRAPRSAARKLQDADPIRKAVSNLGPTQRIMLAVHGVILVAVAYHGYRRNKNSVPWGLGWAVGGLVCPTVTMAFALTQGYAKSQKQEG